MLKLYAHLNRLSVNSLKLHVALAEAGAEYEFIPVDLGAGEQRRPDFLAKNPHGKIPVLVDDGFALAESDAILWYVAERFPAAGLLGEGPRARARALQWVSFASSTLYSGYLEAYTHTVAAPPERRIAALAGSAQQRLDGAYAVLESVLGDRPSLADAFSVADLAAASVLRAVQDRLAFDADAHPHTMAWYRRVIGRPSWQQVVG